VTLLVNLSSALLWTILFYCSYAVSLGSSLAVPAALVLVGHWLDGVLGLSAAARTMTDSITVVCALSAAWTGACIHLRALRDTLLVPGGLVVVRIGEAELEASAASDAAVQALADLVAEVAGELGASGFERIFVTPFPTAETPGRQLVLGWPLLACLTRSELKAVVAHEVGHSHGASSRAYEYIWRLNKLVERHCQLTEASLDRMRMGEKPATISWLADPMLEAALGWVRLWLLLPQRLIRRRLGRGNYRVEFYCDRLAAERYGGNVLASALRKIGRLSAAFRRYCEGLDTSSAPEHIFRRFDDFRRQIQDDETLAEEYWKEGVNHPSLRSRLEAVWDAPRRANEGRPWLEETGASSLGPQAERLGAELLGDVARWRALLEEGIALARGDDPARAGAALRAAAAANRASGPAQGWFGVYHGRMRRHWDAQECLLDAWRLMGPRRWSAEPELARAFGDACDAIGDSVPVSLSRASRALEKGDYSEALDALDTAAARGINGEAAGAVIAMRGLCLEALGRLGEARSALEEAHARWPGGDEVRLHLAALRSKMLALQGREEGRS
jgi:Zn-dependent protease with chaperone function